MRPSGKFTYATSVNVNHTTQKAKTRERILSPLTQQPQVHGMRITQHLWTDKYAISVLFLARLVVVSRICPTHSKDQIFSYFWMCIAAGTKKFIHANAAENYVGEMALTSCVWCWG